MREALELCKSELTKPNIVFDLHVCSRDEKRLVNYGEVTLQYLERVIQVSGIRSPLGRNTSAFFFHVVHVLGKLGRYIEIYYCIVTLNVI